MTNIPTSLLHIEVLNRAGQTVLMPLASIVLVEPHGNNSKIILNSGVFYSKTSASAIKTKIQTKLDEVLSDNAAYQISAYASGTPYTLTLTSTALDFGTTDPSIIVDRPGTYLLLASVVLDNGDANSTPDVTFKLRRTNNTAADLSNASVTIKPAFANAANLKSVITLPPVIYATLLTDDVVTTFGSDSAVGDTSFNSAVGAAQIVAVRLSA